MRIDPAGWPFVLGGLVVALIVWLMVGPVYGLASTVEARPLVGELLAGYMDALFEV